jgi:hypothetical protein
MNPSRTLVRLEQRALYRLKALRDTFDISKGHLPDREAKAAICSVVVDALNTWNNFSRAYYLSSCLGAYLPSHGFITTSTTFSSFNDSIGDAIRFHKPWITPLASGEWHRKDEPAWHDPNILLGCCTNIGASNTSHMSAALSVGTRVFIDLVVFRNYIAHKNKRSQVAAQNLAPHYLIPATLRPFEILLQTPLRAFDPLLKVWLYEMEIVVSFLCR